MINHTKKILVALAALGLVAPVMEQSASAVPAFARQMGLACDTCHLQHFPQLSQMGRSFKLSGYTDKADDRAVIEDDSGFSLPVVENMAFLMNMGIGGDKATSTNTVDAPTEVPLWMGGRIAKNWGAAIEFPGPVASFKAVNSHVSGDDRSGLTIFAGGLGTFWGMELFNSGLSANHRQSDNMPWNILALQNPLSDSAGGAAAGVAAQGADASGLAYWGGPANGGDGMYYNLTLWAPATASGIAVDGAPQNLAARVAFNMGALEIGGFLTAGGTVVSSGGFASENSSAMGIDGQFDSGDLLLTFGYLLNTGTDYIKDDSKANVGTTAKLAEPTNIYGGNMGGLSVGASFKMGEATTLVAAMVMPTFSNVIKTGTGSTATYAVAATKTAYDTAKTAGSLHSVGGTVITLGLDYQINKNMRLTPEYSMYSGDVYQTSAADAWHVNLGMGF